MVEFKDIDSMRAGIEDYKSYTEHYNMESISECPICKKKIEPVLIGDITGEYNESLLACPSCDEVFIVKYEDKRYPTDKSTINDIYPHMYTKKNFDKIINDISPSFTKTYNQSKAAEESKLDEIAGMGYRKSIEYLIKDYIIKNKPQIATQIKALSLANCIKQHIDNPDIKDMSERAVWLGNDETHYVKKWEDKDIGDLKNLIDITVYWIIYQEKTKMYKESMQNGKK